MRRPEFIARQSRHPSGLLGRLIARIMSFETARSNEAAIRLLNLEAADRVLEIGFGHGRTIERVAAAVTGGSVAGVDHSQLMVRTARRRNRHGVRNGRVELRLGDSLSLPYPDAHFDKALAVHTLYFWPQPVRHLKEIRRVLADGGLFVLGFTPLEGPSAAERFPEGIYRFYSSDEVQTLLEESGFDAVQIERQPTLQCASGTKVIASGATEGPSGKERTASGALPRPSGKKRDASGALERLSRGR